MVSNKGRNIVVIIYCNIFLPLFLTILSVYLVPLLTLSCVTVPLPLTPWLLSFNTGIPGTVPPLVTICLSYRLDYPTLVMYLTLTRTI